MDTLADIQGSLKEAEGYEKLALLRRRGILGMLSSLPALMFFLFHVFDIRWDPLGWSGLAVVGGLMAFSYGMRATLRHRPGWEPLFPQTRHAIHKVWFAALLVYMLAGASLPAYLSFRAPWTESTKAAVFVLHIAGMMFLAGRAVRRITGLGFVALLLVLLSGLLALGVVPASTDAPWTFGFVWIGLVGYSCWFLLAPRRWLLR